MQNLYEVLYQSAIVTESVPLLPSLETLGLYSQKRKKYNPEYRKHLLHQNSALKKFRVMLSRKIEA